MENLNYLQKDTLVQIISEQDWNLSLLSLELNNKHNELEDMIAKRDYWRNKYNVEAQNEFVRKNVEQGTLQDIKELEEVIMTEIEPPRATELNIQPITVLDTIAKEFTVRRANRKPIKIKKENFATKVKSAAGNVLGTKHAGHKRKDDLLYARFPDGTVNEYTGPSDLDIQKDVNDLRLIQGKKLVKDPARNISHAARNGHKAYAIDWTYDVQIVAEWLK